ncbi:hypothetical protein VIGAN_04306200, partial [Vigna angularis var. angularis]
MTQHQPTFTNIANTITFKTNMTKIIPTNNFNHLSNLTKLFSIKPSLIFSPYVSSICNTLSSMLHTPTSSFLTLPVLSSTFSPFPSFPSSMHH